MTDVSCESAIFQSRLSRKMEVRLATEMLLTSLDLSHQTMTIDDLEVVSGSFSREPHVLRWALSDSTGESQLVIPVHYGW